jgi:glycosyltransferase involved in cell wall biosynthesis
MRILYLTFFESIIRNGIYETQVKQVLCSLANKYRDKITISHFALLPAVRIGRRGVSIFSLSERSEFKVLGQEYERNGVKLRRIFLPIVTLKRWGAQMRLPLLGLLTLISFPVVAFRIARERPDVLHCRSYMATLFALLTKLVFPNLRVVFDPRGFWPEEGVVEGRWSESSLTFRIWKKIEKYIVRHSDITIALSESFADHVRLIHAGAATEVVYTSVDVKKFKLARDLRPDRRRQLNYGHNLVFVYNGSLGTWHDPALLARMYASFRRPECNTRLLVLTTYDKQKLEAAFQSNGLDESEYLITIAKQNDVASYLAAADYGLVPLRKVEQNHPMTVIAETMIGTKVSEYLASGLPIIVNDNVGGLRPLMSEYRIGVFWDSDQPQEVVGKFKQIVENDLLYRADCNYVATRYFSLDEVTRAYFSIYERLSQEQVLDNAQVVVQAAEPVKDEQESMR